MAKIPTSSRPGPNLKSGEKPLQNNAVPTVPTSSPIIDWEREKYNEMGICRTHREEVGTVGTEPTNLTQLWDGHGLVQVGHPSRRFVALNESGTQRIGQDHARAKLSNAQVEAIRDEHEAYPLGDPRHVGYRRLAEKWKVSERTIRSFALV
jgi:hypothetical protein